MTVFSDNHIVTIATFMFRFTGCLRAEDTVGVEDGATAATVGVEGRATAVVVCTSADTAGWVQLVAWAQGWATVTRVAVLAAGRVVALSPLPFSVTIADNRKRGLVELGEDTRVRKVLERRSASRGARVVHEPMLTARPEEIRPAFTNDKTEEHQAAVRLRGEDERIGDEVRVDVVGGVDAVVGYERRGSGAECDLDGAHELGGPGFAGGSGGVVTVEEVGRCVHEHEIWPREALLVGVAMIWRTQQGTIHRSPHLFFEIFF
jgi:hypothetical protein